MCIYIYIYIYICKYNHEFSCDRKCLVYLITCRTCKPQYTGQTCDAFWKCWTNYRCCDRKADPVDPGRKLNVHKTFRRRPGRFLNVLYTFNLRPVSTGERVDECKQKYLH